MEGCRGNAALGGKWGRPKIESPLRPPPLRENQTKGRAQMRMTHSRIIPLNSHMRSCTLLPTQGANWKSLEHWGLIQLKKNPGKNPSQIYSVKKS